MTLQTPLSIESETITSRIHDVMLGHPFLYFDEVTSTNDMARQFAMDGGPEGLTVAARQQTMGRGRQGKPWESGVGKGVYFSMILRPGWKSKNAGWLGVLGGIITFHALKELGLKDLTIKWPNDLLVGHRKIAGILVEPRVTHHEIEYAVLGVGVNVLHEDKDWPNALIETAVSFRQLGIDCSCEDVMVSLVYQLDTWYQKVREGDFELLRTEWINAGGMDLLPTLE